MKTPAFAFVIISTPAPFHSVTARPCRVLEIFEATRTARLEMTGFKGIPCERYADFGDIASTPARALAEIEKRLEAAHSALTATNEKSAAAQVAGGVAV